MSSDDSSKKKRSASKDSRDLADTIKEAWPKNAGTRKAPAAAAAKTIREVVHTDADTIKEDVQARIETPSDEASSKGTNRGKRAQTITSLKKSCISFVERQKEQKTCPLCGKISASAGSMTAWMFQEFRCTCKKNMVLAQAQEIIAESSKEETRYSNSLLGKVVDSKYKIDCPLGKGRASTVYRAIHLAADRTVAIKIVSAEQSEDDSDKAMKRLRREAQAILDIRHPNIVAVYDFGFIDQSTAYLVMECLHGQTLCEYLEKQVKMDQALAVPLFKQLLQALHEVHARGVINRDIKTNNIMLIEENDQLVAKLVDFGLAKVDVFDVDVPITRSGELLGTPLYMSPEQCMGRRADVRSDIYSLGCVMYEVLTGAPPFVADSFFGVMRAHVRKQPRRLKTALPTGEVSPALENIVLSMLEKDPDKRPQSAARILASLEKSVDKSQSIGSLLQALLNRSRS